MTNTLRLVVNSLAINGTPVYVLGNVFVMAGITMRGEKMNDNYSKKKPSGLLHSADELKQLIAENPDLPIVVFAGDDANTGDYTYMSCNYVSATKGGFLDCDQQIDECRCYTDRDDFEDDVYTVLEGEERYDDLSDEEFDSVVKQKITEYDAFWKPCIILYVDHVGH